MRSHLCERRATVFHSTISSLLPPPRSAVGRSRDFHALASSDPRMKRTAAAPRTAVVSSSPGRAEKLPAPPGLAKLLRGKSGSRSRGRTSAARSSPMFLSKSRSVGTPSTAAAVAAAADGEPSSPKVTCIGQVRIRGKSKGKGKNLNLASGSKKSNPDEQAATRCRCIERAFLCKIFSVRKSPPPGRPHRRPLWRRWALGSIRSGRYKQQKAFEKGEADLVTYPVASATATVSVPDLDDGDETEEEETSVFMPAAAAAAPPPPKNALLLMRCRSAPHNRSSALATARFAVSPPPLVVSPETPTAEPCIVVISSGDAAEAEAEGPVVLTRSKSEPARTAAEKLVVIPEAAAFWKSSSGSSRRPLELVEEEWGPQPPARVHTS